MLRATNTLQSLRGGESANFRPMVACWLKSTRPSNAHYALLFSGSLKTQYVTTACHGRSAAELAMFALSGAVFSMRVEVPGLTVNFFVD